MGVVEEERKRTELINKYRPGTFKQVIGQKPAVASLAEAIAKERARAFLFVGPSGVGKTTLARIAALKAGAVAYGDIQEIDGATHTGIDAMRAVMDATSYRPVGDSKAKAVIVDECHALSKQAIQSLLKATEEPPSWLYWFMCSTEPNRLPVTLRTRFFTVQLKPVPFKVLQDHLDYIAGKEKMTCPDNVIDACADAAEGSVRQAISNLAMCATVKTTKELEDILKTATDSAEAHQLARALMFGSWGEARTLLGKLGETSPESVRYVVRAYVSKVIRGAKKDSVAGRGCEVLDAFSQPFYDNASLDLAVGKVLLQ